MSAMTSYNNSSGVIAVQGEVEYAADPASGAFFQPDYKKNDDLKMMLDSSKDSLKLEAMKRIIGMIAKGRDASDLFPAVVKNVVSKNIEVKKLVYVYLVRYAEEQQDLALLSISTFQRALKDPNQLIRASALRVLSSIRVSMIVPIVMLAIRDAASDMSPYVRKTAAHAIPKLYSLEMDQKEELVGIIDKLLSDKAPLVVGSAAMAFSEVCPERSSLIHKSYRKLCSLLVDVDEWGQLVLLSVLTRYAREHFCDPNSEKRDSDITDTERPFYSFSESESSGDCDAKKKKKKRSLEPILDPDHKLLLRAAKPLLQSRNSGVVMAVAQLFYHCGPATDLALAAKALIRLLRSPKEIQSIVLHTIASLNLCESMTFEPYLKSFFVRSNEATHIKLLKLEILTSLANATNVSVILRELQTYVRSNDKTFAGATIQAIGRIATEIDSVTDTCLNGLLQLLSSKDEWIVCEAVVTVKHIVSGTGGHGAAVARATKLLLRGSLGGAGARAAAVWLVAEHGAAAGSAALPALLAHFIKEQRFTEQDELVKLQLLSLAVKLSITQPETLPLAQHILTLARYDACYDVRDRARFLRRFMEPNGGRLAREARKIFLEQKPVPLMENKFKDHQQYTLGTLSHYVGTRAPGYVSLPSFPEQTLGAREREPESDRIAVEVRSKVEKTKEEKSFYSEPEGSSESDSSDSSSSDSSSEEEAQSEGPEKKENNAKEDSWNYENSKLSKSGTSDSESDSSNSSSSSSDNSDDEESSSSKEDVKPPQKPSDRKPEQSKNEKSNLELLLELDEVASSLPTMTPSYGGFLSPTATTTVPDEITPVAASYVDHRSHELISRLVAGGLAVAYRFTRAPHLLTDKMAAVELTFVNHCSDSISQIAVSQSSGSTFIHDFAPIATLPIGASVTTTMGIDFADTIKPVFFTIVSSRGDNNTSIKPPVGELMRAVTMSDARWDSEQRKLRGMTECEKKVPSPGDSKITCMKVFETANVACVTSTGDFLRFAGRLLSSQELVLASVRTDGSTAHVTVNCSNMAVASLLLNEITNAFVQAIS